MACADGSSHSKHGRELGLSRAVLGWTLSWKGYCPIGACSNDCGCKRDSCRTLIDGYWEVRGRRDDGRMQQGQGCSAALEPLSDDLIRRCLAVGPWDHNGKPLWHRLLDWAVDAGARPAPSALLIKMAS